MSTPAPRSVLCPVNTPAVPARQDSTPAYATPATGKLPAATPLTRASSWSAVALRSPSDESALLRQLSSVVKDHLDTVTKAAKRSAAERAAAEAAAAAELELLHAELATENSYPSEQKPACGWAENLGLRMSLWSMVSELSELISLPEAADLSATLHSWAEGGMLATVAVAGMAVAGIQQRLMEAAPEGYEPSAPNTPEAAAPETPVALALQEPIIAEAAKPAAKQPKRRKPLLLRLLFAGVIAAGAAAAAIEVQKQLELQTKRAPKPAAPKLEPAAEAAAPAAASA